MYRRYRLDGCFTIRSRQMEGGELSEGFVLPTPLEVGGLSFATARHAWEAAKFGHDRELQRLVAGQGDPNDARRMGKAFLARPQGVAQRVNSMRWLVRALRESNQEMFDGVLEASGEMPIIRVSGHDRIWGALESGGKAEGMNALGRLWEELRTDLRLGNEERAGSGYWKCPFAEATTEPDPNLIRFFNVRAQPGQEDVFDPLRNEALQIVGFDRSDIAVLVAPTEGWKPEDMIDTAVSLAGRTENGADALLGGTRIGSTWLPAAPAWKPTVDADLPVP